MYRVISFYLILASVISIAEAGFAKTGSIRVSVPTKKLILDPHKMEDAYSMSAVLQLYRGLLRYTPESNIAPDLAETWTESEDHRKYVLKLRQAKFSNGEQITAKNVVASFGRLFSIDSSKCHKPNRRNCKFSFIFSA